MQKFTNPKLLLMVLRRLLDGLLVGVDHHHGLVLVVVVVRVGLC